MDFNRIKKILACESSDYNLTDSKIYQLVLEFTEDEKLSDTFMLSEFGGYTEGQLNEIKYQQKYRKKRYEGENISHRPGVAF